MTTYFISRHPGAQRWAVKRGLAVDEWLSHLDIDIVGPGDTIIGTLPVNMAAAVCGRGAHYVHLALLLPAHARGRELTVAELDDFDARLQPFSISPAPMPVLFKGEKT